MFDLCSPTILYIGFSTIQIIIDTLQHAYNRAILKFFVMIIFTIILNLLCKSGLTLISWFIVFIPFIFMTVITTTLLFIFGIDPNKENFNK